MKLEEFLEIKKITFPIHRKKFAELFTEYSKIVCALQREQCFENLKLKVENMDDSVYNSILNTSDVNIGG